EPWRSDPLEGSLRPPSFGQIGALDQDDTGIERRGGERAQVRRRIHPAQLRLVEPHAAPPALKLHHRQLGPHTELAIEEVAELANGEPVAHGDRRWPDERDKPRIKHVALDLIAAD